MFCSKCGCELTGSKRFCTYCGAQQVPTSGQGRTAVPRQTPVQKRAIPIRTADFKVGPDTLFIVFVFYCTVLPLIGISNGVLLFLAVLLRGGTAGEFLIAFIFGILLGAVCFILFVAGLIVLVRSSLSFRVSGRTITVRKLYMRREYDCSDIVRVECLLPRYYRHVIRLTFRDGKTYDIGWKAPYIKEFAAYLLDMLRTGVIPQDAVYKEHAERLVMTSEGRKWEIPR